MSYETIYTNEYVINMLAKIENKITFFNYDKSKNSIGKQLDLFQDFKDIVLEINSNKILFPDFYIQLKISPRTGWNGKGITNRYLK